MERVAVGTEVANVECGQLSVSASRRQRRPHEKAESGRTSVNRSLSLVDRKIASTRRVHARVGLHVAPRRRSVLSLRGEIQRGLQDCQRAVSRAPPPPRRLLVRGFLVLKRRTFRGANPGRCGGELLVPLGYGRSRKIADRGLTERGQDVARVRERASRTLLQSFSRCNR